MQNRLSVFGALQIANNPVMVLSRLGPDFADGPARLQAWKVHSRLKYYIKGLDCDMHMIGLVTRMVACRALEGADAKFACSRDSPDIEDLLYLQVAHISAK